MKAAGGFPRGRGRGSSNEAAKSEPLGDRCRLIVKLTSETKDGPVPKGAKVILKDNGPGKEFMIQRFGDAGDVSENSPDENGIAVVGPFEPGRYWLQIRFPDGRHTDDKLPLMKPGEERTLDIVCPPPATKTTVLITAPPVPEDLAGPTFRGSLSSISNRFS